MRMTEDEAYEILSNGLVNAPSEHEWCVAFKTAIETMHKYQKIETIIKMWKEDRKRFTLGDNGSKDEYLRQISEVLEDGKID